MRLIDADKLMEYVKGRKTRNYPKGELEWTIEQLPTIEAVPVVHGEWILHRIGAGHMWECSVCHKRPDIYITNNTNFCPNCGAKMKE